MLSEFQKKIYEILKKCLQFVKKYDIIDAVRLARQVLGLCPVCALHTCIIESCHKNALASKGLYITKQALTAAMP